MLAPTSLVGAMIPESWWNLGLDWTWKYRETGQSKAQKKKKKSLAGNKVLIFRDKQHSSTINMISSLLFRG
jgi:hypothetical protein